GNETVLDICSAPGGKSLILADRLGPGGRLIAADRSAGRQRLTRENFACRNFACAWEIITSAAETPDLPLAAFDLVLADVPCTNTGVFRHKPDALWRFSEKSLESTVKLQRSILERAAALTAPGGTLVYSTCSIEQEENQLQVAALLAADRNFELLEEKLLLPEKFHDGAYAALLQRQGERKI
ncbi:MAG: RsmB/NOP family class I SAM-dependent RNA methyltransferase, partial [Victivallales bacterium]|nr:RsmB/NOP family class I SAM-dependent RNA methyltransferase [Victivallales bacterium]